MATGPDPEDAELMRDVFGTAPRLGGSTRAGPRTTSSSRRTTSISSWRGSGSGSATSRPTPCGPTSIRADRPIPPSPIRPAEREDIPLLARLEAELPRHQGLSPCFSTGHLETVEEAQQEWEEDWGDPDYPTWVAVHEGRVVGSAIGCALTKSELQQRPDPARARRVPRLRGRRAAGPRARRGARARRDGDAVVRRGRVRLRRDRLEADQPALVAGLAGARLRAHVPAPAPDDRLLDRRCCPSRLAPWSAPLAAARPPAVAARARPPAAPRPHRGNPDHSPNRPDYCDPVQTRTYFFGYPPGAPARAAC